jgi:hypothetical protein
VCIKNQAKDLMFDKFVVAFFLLSANIAHSCCLFQDILPTDSIIEWQSHRLLKESDFKGVVDLADFDALTFTRVSYFSITYPKGKYSFFVKASFFPNKSWKRSQMSPMLLMHEQVHFNIAELVARRVRAHVRGAEIDNHNFDQYVLEIDEIIKERHMLGDKYDQETFHGQIENQQLEWQKNIDEQLAELKEYELKDGIELYKYRELIQHKPTADSVKEWHSKKSLKWSDFKLENPTSASFRAGSTTNVIFTCDTLSNRKYKLNIKAYFFPYESNKGSSLLVHEQVHFNIAELVARKMRANIRGIEIDSSNIDSLVWKILSIKSELDVLHKKHDRETAKGKVIARQSEWQKRIEKQLAELKEYELRDGIELYRHTKRDK